MEEINDQNENSKEWRFRNIDICISKSLIEYVKI